MIKKPNGEINIYSTLKRLIGREIVEHLDKKFADKLNNKLIKESSEILIDERIIELNKGITKNKSIFLNHILGEKLAEGLEGNLIEELNENLINKLDNKLIEKRIDTTTRERTKINANKQLKGHSVSEDLFDEELAKKVDKIYDLEKRIEKLEKVLNNISDCFCGKRSSR